MKNLKVADRAQIDAIDELLDKKITQEISKDKSEKIKNLAARLEGELEERITELFGNGTTSIRDIYGDLHDLFELFQNPLAQKE